jgi:hypothetical protein
MSEPDDPQYGDVEGVVVASLERGCAGCHRVKRRARRQPFVHCRALSTKS